MRTGNLIVAQGGGPTMSINNCLRGIIEQATEEPSVDGVYGAKYGFEGILHENLVDLEAESRDTIESLRSTPGAALGSSRAKLSDEDFEQILETFRTHDVRYVLYIGGNGSMAGCHRIHSMVTEEKMDVRILGIPSTIDNDILHTDHCPGYGSASRYYAVSIRELGRDIESLPTPVSVFETMGRNTGWLAASTGLARDTEATAPHLIYVPECPFTPDQFLDDVQRVYDELGWVVIAVSEGVGETHEIPLSASQVEGGTDDFGRGVPGDIGGHLADLVSDKLGLRARSEKPGLCGRVSVAHASDVDLHEAYELGQTAVQWAVQGERGSMTALQRTEGAEYNCTYERVALDSVLDEERSLASHFMNETGNMVTQDFRNYAAPLIGDSLPQYPRLTEHPIASPEKPRAK